MGFLNRGSVLLVAVLLVLSVAGAANGQGNKRVAYTLRLRAVDYYDDGRVIETYNETRYVSANGDWKSVKQYHGGFVQESVGMVGRGVFLVDSKAKKLRFRAPYPSNSIPDAETRSRSNKVVKRLGYEAYVIRIPRGGNTMFITRAPALNGDVIEIMTRQAGFTRVVEPVSITIGQPPGMMLSYDNFAVEHPKSK
jgi:hypothetical protein